MLLEIRDLWPAFLIENNLLTFKPLALAMEWLEATAYRYANHIVPVAPSFTAYLREMGVASERMTTIPTGGDPAYSSANRAAGGQWIQNHGLAGKFIVLYAGSSSDGLA
jgi:hypothetical protein